MPSLAEIVRYFTGAARLMAGRRDGLALLDLSADGFWRSFAALVVALPPTVLAWLEYETVERPPFSPHPGRLAIYGAHALADVTAWLLPILLLASFARPLGFSRKMVPLVVATNWGGALLAWIFSPFFVLLLLAGSSDVTALIGLFVAIASIVLTVRLVANATVTELPLSVAIVTMMVFVSLLSYAAVSDLFGVTLA
ncbi:MULTISPECIES: hypothetical protein [unclassified Aureimonas]|uniref:hypothetical protein n=1 Tax=unclassified Aureimonas TaxID=2615206 RepID=UPI0007209AB9|nr:MULTISPECIES: hypothetical protein [unclassified Aureimonas]ALN71997.1 hypothetical protein M673_04670 [Aureimonas sp. AU20]